MTIEEMWSLYLDSLGETLESTNKSYEAWHFCNNEKDANELAELTKKGTKRATAGLLKAYEYDSDPIPKKGDLHIITDWDKNAVCIIKVKAVEILPFKDITQKHASIEGEGDGSLKYWRDGHHKFFKMDCESMGISFTEDLEVIFMIFDVIFKG